MSFYSPIDRLAQNLPRPKGTGAEFMTELSKMPGYKTQEAEDRGLQALTNLPKMERAQFMEALKAKPPVVPKVISNDGTDDPRYLTREERLYGGNENQAFHEQYTLPGGTNYREILLKHPLPQKAFSGVQQHFGGEGNILASVRAKDRRGPNGEKILHIEELQSDWHQQGREKGYTPPDVQKQINNAERAHRELKKQLEEAKLNAVYAETGLNDPRTKRLRDLNPEVNQRLEAAKIKHNNTIMELMPQVMKAEAEHQDLLHQSKNTVPDAPFKKSWHEMALKKMIHHAAANGYDSIAITPGAEQADRYGLSKHIDSLELFPTLYSNNPKPLVLRGHKNKNQIISKEVSEDDLPGLLGEDLAKKLLNAPANHIGTKQLGGVDLETDERAKGMKGFYDKIVPNFLNQFGKKYGAKVGQVQVPVVHALQGLRRVNNYPDDPPLNLHHFPITPEMREDVVKNGVPLYADGGSVEGEEPKKTVKAYKLFRVHPKHPGKLFPLFVDANTPVEMDKWIDAKEGEMAKGKVKSKIGPLAYRPGWHAGDLPIATHIGEKSDPSLTAPDVRPENHAWAEVEMPDDVDWQAEATKRGTNAQGRVIPVKAHITDQIPKGGHYRYKTNPNMTGNWLIGGSMKVNRVLTDKEVAKINKAAGLADLPRAQPFKAKKFGFAGGGTVAPDEWKAEEHVNHMADGGPVPPLRPLNPQLAAMREQLAAQSALHKAYDEAMKNVYTNQMPTFAQWVKSQGKAKGGLAHMAGGSIEYQGEHKPPSESYGAPLHDLTQVYPEDIYSNKALQYYGMGHPEHKKMDMESLFKAQMYRDKPNASVSVFRAVPEHINEINPKDWVTLSPAYAKLHGESRLGGKYKTLKKMVKAKELWTAGDSIHEWGYHPEEKKAAGGRVKPVGYTKEQVTVSPNLDAMRYELMSVKRYTKKVK